MCIKAILAIIKGGGGGGGSTPPSSGNTIVALWTEDIARDWVRVEFDNSIGVTSPAPEQFTITGKTVEEVVMLSDKVLYLRVDSHFAAGDSLELSYTASGSLLGSLGDQSAIPITNNISAIPFFSWSTSRINHYNNQDTDLNAALGIDDNGAVIELDSINFGTVDIGRGTNLTFVAKFGGDTTCTYFNAREAVLHFTLMGHPAKASKNLKIHNGKAYFGIGCFATGNLRFEDIDIYDVVQGMQVKTVSDWDYPPYNLSRAAYQNLTTKRISVSDTSQEAYYIGSDVPAPLIPITWNGEDLSADDIGYDAYQFRNGSCYLNRITWNNVGLIENSNHAHGFLFGTTTDGGSLSNVTGRGTYGYGLSINGYGTFNITNVDVESQFNTVYIRNYDGHDDYSTGGLTVNFSGTNRFDTTRTTTDPRSLDARRNAALPTTITLNINAATTFVDTPYIESWPEEEIPGAPGQFWGGIVVNYT